MDYVFLLIFELFPSIYEPTTSRKGILVGLKSVWGNMSIRRLLFSEHYKNQTKRVGLVQSEPHHRLIEN